MTDLFPPARSPIYFLQRGEEPGLSEVERYLTEHGITAKGFDFAFAIRILRQGMATAP